LGWGEGAFRGADGPQYIFYVRTVEEWKIKKLGWKWVTVIASIRNVSQ
jgi:hypothetical protein